MSQITTAEFEQMLAEQYRYSAKKWTDLEINKIYTIVDYDITDAYNKESMLIILEDDTEVWAPGHLKEKIEQARKAGKWPPYYIRPLGLKPCKNNRKNKYHAYDFVVPQ